MIPHRNSRQHQISQNMDRIQKQVGIFVLPTLPRSRKTTQKFFYLGWFVVGVLLLIISVLIYDFYQKKEKKEKEKKKNK